LGRFEGDVTVRFRRRDDDRNRSSVSRNYVARMTGWTAVPRVVIFVAGIEGGKLEQQDAGQQNAEKLQASGLAHRRHVCIEYSDFARYASRPI